MAARIGRYIFRRIGGRIVPIRIGAKEGAGVSASAARKLKLLTSRSDISVGKTGKLRKALSHSGTDSMEKFMRDSGAVRFSAQENSVAFSFARRLTDAQKRTLKDMSEHADEVIAGYKKGGKSGPVDALNDDESVFQSIADFFRSPMSKKGTIEELVKGKGVREEVVEKLEEKALKKFGTTDNPFETGYITRSGDALDLSGKKFGGSSGVRHLDHREVSEIVSMKNFASPTRQDIKQAMRMAQNARKAQNRRAHELTNLKKDVNRLAGKPRLKEAYEALKERMSVLEAEKRLRKLRKK